jgi:uncharacterized Zn finger protein
MEVMTRRPGGLFPAPREICMECSCPDYATLCKHVAAVFYGIGARLDDRPELLFRLRQVDESDLIAAAGKDLPLSKNAPGKERLLAGGDLSALFGLDIAAESVGAPPARARARRKPKRSR